MKYNDEDLLSMNEITEYARVGRGAIYAAIKKGRLKAKKVGVTWKISREEIDRYRVTKYNRDIRQIDGERIFDVEKGTFSAPQVAKILSEELQIAYSIQRVYHLIRTGQLKSHKRGATFVINRDSLVKLIELEREVKNEDYRQFKMASF